MDNLNKHQTLFKAVSFIRAIVNLSLKNIMNYLLKMFPKEKRKFVKHMNWEFQWNNWITVLEKKVRFSYSSIYFLLTKWILL